MKWIIFFWFCGTMSVLAQQETQFTQYVFNTMHVNPAYAGYKGETYFQSFYRSQWVGLDGAPKTLSFSIDCPQSEAIFVENRYPYHQKIRSYKRPNELMTNEPINYKRSNELLQSKHQPISTNRF